MKPRPRPTRDDPGDVRGSDHRWSCQRPGRTRSHREGSRRLGDRTAEDGDETDRGTGRLQQGARPSDTHSGAPAAQCRSEPAGLPADRTEQAPRNVRLRRVRRTCGALEGLGDQFTRMYPKVRINVDPPYAGSLGALALIDGKLDCVFASRELKPSDDVAFRNKFGHDRPPSRSRAAATGTSASWTRWVSSSTTRTRSTGCRSTSSTGCCRRPGTAVVRRSAPGATSG